MQVAEKQEEYTRKKVSLAKEQRTHAAAPATRELIHRFTDGRGTYDATSDGTPVAMPTLSQKASQPTPFMSLSWEQWLQVREQITRNLESFVNAAAEHRADKVLNIGMEIQSALTHIFLEAYVMSADLGLKPLPE